MSDCNRSQRCANWLAWATGSILILLAASGGIYGITQQIGYQQAAEDHAQEYARYAREKAEQSCRVLTPLKLSQCLANAQREQENDAREKRREYADLVAQQKSALWTNIMGLSAITGMILSVIGVWLIYATFRETKRTADEAKRSADAFIAAERGWLEISANSVKGSADGATIKLQISGRVTGKAGIKIASLHCRQLDSDMFPTDGLWEVGFPRMSSLEPENPPAWAYLTTFELPNAEGFVGGWAVYQTQFPGEKTAHFVFKMEVGSTYGDGSVRYSPRKINGTGWPDDT